MFRAQQPITRIREPSPRRTFSRIANTTHINYDDSRIDSGDSWTMARKGTDWRGRVKGLLKAELKRRDLSYADLSAKLGALGISDSERNISNKISRGGFTAIFFVQCMEAIGCRTIHLIDE